jgi:hypothetical protein
MPRSTLGWIVAVLVVGAGIVIFRSSGTYRVPEHAPQRPTAPVPSSQAALPSASPSAEQAPVAAPAPSGSAAPELPADAPKSVSFGVVLVTYTGAEMSPPEAPSKQVALAKARALVTEARTSFDEAVKKGDRGSTVQAGTMPRGVLEPNIEFILFTLKKGEVYGEPLDTPRGYWVLRRNE